MKTNATVWAFSLSMAVLTTNVNAAVIAATGETNLYYKEFSGTLSGVNLETGSGTVASGTISYMLDTTYGTNNYWNNNWDTMTATVNLHLLVTFPTVGDLGITDPIAILIQETGDLHTVPMIDTDLNQLAFDYSETVNVTGGGTVGSGPLAGVVFANWNSHEWHIRIGEAKVEVPAMKIEVKDVDIGGTSRQTGTIQQPGNAPQATDGSGHGTANGIPEPFSFELFGIGFAMLFASSRRRPK